jgi:hypothetical protein
VELSGTYNYFATPNLTTARTLIVGLHFRVLAGSTNDVFSLRHPDASATAGIVINWYATTRELRVYRGGTLLGTTSTNGAFASGRWHWIEVKVYCDDAAGTVEIRHGGRTVYTFTGDTRNHATYNYYCAVSFGRGFAYDNLYVCDDTGANNNNFLGPVRITTSFPSAAGDAAEWDGSGVESHYTFVDDSPGADDDVTYVESAVAGAKELWNYADTSVTGTIHAVQMLTLARATDALCVDITPLRKTGGVESDGEAVTASIDYAELPNLMERQPGGAAWTAAALNGYQFGVKVG